MKDAARTLLATREDDWGPTLLRAPMAAIFIVHGAQKLFGWFGGRGLKPTVAGFEGIGIPRGLGYLAPFTEFLGGLGLLTGFLTRPSALGIATVMAVATAKVHWRHGFFMNWENDPEKGHGVEMTMALAGAALSLVATGGGALSVDSLLASREEEEGRLEVLAPEVLPGAAESR